MTHSAPLIACPDCDLLQREVVAARGCAVRCRRCGATLYRNASDSLNRTLALSLAAIVVYLMANVFPIIGIEGFGDNNFATLFDSVSFLWSRHMEAMAALVFFTAILIPGLEISVIIYLLLPLKFDMVPAAAPKVLRLMQKMKPWGMVEVFMLGILVSVARLKYSFSVFPDVALWAFAALTILFTATAASFNARDVWAYLEAYEAKGRKP